jgi:hypothetical protein
VADMVLLTELEVVVEEPLLAVLTFHTENDSAEFEINLSVALGLIDMLTKFVTREAKPS